MDQALSDPDKSLAEEWDTAEAAIKQAELVSGAIVMPAVNELRYAGRRIVDGVRTTNDIERTKLIAEAEWHCRVATSDAVDAQALYWISLFNQLERDGSLSAAPDEALAELRATIQAVGAEIARSKGKKGGASRALCRDPAIYIRQLSDRLSAIKSLCPPEAMRIAVLLIEGRLRDVELDVSVISMS